MLSDHNIKASYKLEREILKTAKRIQAISQTGIRFTKDNFDKQRFEELRELSVQLVSQVSDAKVDKIRDLNGGELRGSDETVETRFFDFDKLPILSVKRNTYELIDLIKLRIDNEQTYTD